MADKHQSSDGTGGNLVRTLQHPATVTPSWSTLNLRDDLPGEAKDAGLSNANPLQLASRDLHAINMHGLLTLKTNLETYGRVLAGLPANSATI